MPNPVSFDDISIWVICFGSIVSVILAIEAGYQLAKLMNRGSDREKEAQVSAISNVVLGLAGFLLAFTFGIAGERNQAKRALVRDEAAAIRTAWHRSEFLPTTDHREAVKLMREYVDLRVAFVNEGSLEAARVERALSETVDLQNRLWAMAVRNARKDMNSDVAALYIDSLNQVIEYHSKRVAIGIQARIPVEIWLALFFVTLLGMMSVGYQAGAVASKRSMAWILLALSFPLVFSLNILLDRPDSGVMKVTQQPLIDLANAMKAGL